MSDMDNIYYISKDDPDLLVNKIGMIEEGYDPWGMDESLLRDLDDSIEKRWVECRYHQRFQLDKDAFALITPISTDGLKTSR